MKFKEVEMKLGLTISPRQYDSVRVDARVVLELAENENPDDAFALARDKLNVQVEQQMAQTLTRLGAGPADPLPPAKKTVIL